MKKDTWIISIAVILVAISVFMMANALSNISAQLSQINNKLTVQQQHSNTEQQHSTQTGTTAIFDKDTGSFAFLGTFKPDPTTIEYKPYFIYRIQREIAENLLDMDGVRVLYTKFGIALYVDRVELWQESNMEEYKICLEGDLLLPSTATDIATGLYQIHPLFNNKRMMTCFFTGDNSEELQRVYYDYVQKHFPLAVKIDQMASGRPKDFEILINGLMHMSYREIDEQTFNKMASLLRKNHAEVKNDGKYIHYKGTNGEIILETHEIKDAGTFYNVDVLVYRK